MTIPQAPSPEHIECRRGDTFIGWADPDQARQILRNGQGRLIRIRRENVRYIKLGFEACEIVGGSDGHPVLPGSLGDLLRDQKLTFVDRFESGVHAHSLKDLAGVEIELASAIRLREEEIAAWQYVLTRPDHRDMWPQARQRIRELEGQRSFRAQAGASEGVRLYRTVLLSVAVDVE